MFKAWARLFENGPGTLELTGDYSWLDGEAEDEGRYEKIQFAKDDTVRVLNELAMYCEKVLAANGRLYIYHGGV